MFEGLSQQEPEVQDFCNIPGFAQLRLDYIERLSREVALLDGALASADFNRIRTSGHNMKGNGGAYGFEPISTFGRDLESNARNGNAPEIQATLSELRNYLASVAVC